MNGYDLSHHSAEQIKAMEEHEKLMSNLASQQLIQGQTMYSNMVINGNMIPGPNNYMYYQNVPQSMIPHQLLSLENIHNNHHQQQNNGDYNLQNFYKYFQNNLGKNPGNTSAPSNKNNNINKKINDNGDNQEHKEPIEARSVKYLQEFGYNNHNFMVRFFY
jgi:hypothetical protein